MDAEQKNKLVFIGVAGAIVVLLGVVYFTLRTPKNSVDSPNGTWWTCQKCNNKFNVSTSALSKFQQEHYGERYPCPKCGSVELLRSVKCPKCGEIYPTGGDRRGEPTKCPKCGTPEPTNLQEG